MKDTLNGKLILEGLTFDDVLLIPQKSNVLPNQVDLKTQLSEKLKLNIPFISSAMDSVTESKMAIAIARCGGIGVIHKNLSIHHQKTEVEKVKRNESGFIKDPITLSKNKKISDAEKLMAKYKISGLPVVDSDNILLGIITNRDIKSSRSMDDYIYKYMTKDNIITANIDISLDEAANIMLKNRIEKLPIINKKNQLQGLITIKDIDNREEYPFAAKDQFGRLLCAAAVGCGEDSLKRVAALIEVGVDLIVVDSAHGHSEKILDTVKKIRKLYPKLDLAAGNIVTSKAASDLINAGANIVKVGVGPGSICTTRIVAGVGMPQLSAISNIAKICKTKSVALIADGGIKYSGDVIKALAVGADSVMMGNAFAGTTESPGEEIIMNGRKYKNYMGMGSLSAMSKGSHERYFQEKNSKLVPEGIEATVSFKGKVSDVLFQFSGGIKSGMGYCGAKNIIELQAKAKFVKITNSGLKESHPHSLESIKEAPNYRN